MHEHVFMISEELMILSSVKKKIHKLLDPLSVSVRACLLADLCYQHLITIQNEHIVARNNVQSSSKILDDIMYRISIHRADTRKWIKLLNGESYKHAHLYLRKVRKKILLSLEQKNAVKFEDRLYYKTEVNKDIKEKIIDRLVDYIDGRQPDVRNDMLLVSLEYSGCLGIVFGGCTGKVFDKLRNRLHELKKWLKHKYLYGEDNRIIYELMKYMFNC